MFGSLADLRTSCRRRLIFALWASEMLIFTCMEVRKCIGFMIYLVLRWSWRDWPCWLQGGGGELRCTDSQGPPSGAESGICKYHFLIFVRCGVNISFKASSQKHRRSVNVCEGNFGGHTSDCKVTLERSALHLSTKPELHTAPMQCYPPDGDKAVNGVLSSHV